MSNLNQINSFNSNQSNSSQFVYSDNDHSIILIGSNLNTSRPLRSTWSRSANIDVVDLTKKTEPSVSAAPTSDDDSHIRSMLAEGHAVEPYLLKLDCPVCMESFLSIIKKGNKVMATICGHVFCQECLFTAVKTNRKCPSCREILHLNSKFKTYAHRLHLPISLSKESVS